MSNVLSWKSVVIRDGFTQTGYIRENPGLHGELRFSYRPMLPEAVDDIEAHRRVKKGSDDTKLVIAAISERLVSLQQDDGTDLEATAENVRRLRYSLLYRVYNIIAGIEATDVDPKADKNNGGELPPLPSSLMEQIKN